MKKTILTGLLVGLIVVLHSHDVLCQVPVFKPVILPGHAVDARFRSAVQDNEGLIWLGSEDGLFLYDGYTIEQVGPDTLPLAVTALSAAKGTGIWVGCRDGSLFHVSGGQTRIFQPEEGTAGKAVSDILFTADSTLWWSTHGEGIYYYINNRVFNINKDDGLNDNYVYDLEVDGEGGIIAATDAGIVICRIKDGSKEVINPAVNRQLPDIIARKLITDPAGNIFIGLQDAGPVYIRKNGDGYSMDHFIEEWNLGPVVDMILMDDAFWVGTSDNGIVEVSTSGWKITGNWFEDHEGGSFAKVSDILPDTEGNTWIISGSGLYRSPGDRLVFIREIEGHRLGDVHSILSDSKGKIWYSTDEGLFCTSGKNKTSGYLEALFRSNFKVVSLNEDRHGFIWAGTFDHGVFRIDSSTGKYKQFTENEGLVNNNVLSVSVHMDTLWMATLGGASSAILQGSLLAGPVRFKSYNQSNGLVNNFIYTVFEDSRNRIWFGTDGDGLSVLSEGNFTSYDEKDGLEDDVILSITEDGDGRLWFSTATAGIYCFDGQTFKRYGPENGLRDLEISSLEFTAGEIVVVHASGLDIIDAATGKIVPFGEELGLSEIQPDINAAFKDSKGSIWIGTKDGIIRYRPGYPGKSLGPVTRLESLSVLLEPVDMLENSSFGSKQNHMTFRYAGLWYSDPGQVLYQVKLEGYDLDWQTTYDRTATYSSLPPGQYIFRVRSSLDPIFENESEAAYSFRIRPPFWRSPFFITGILLVAGALVYLVIRVRERKLRLEEERKKEKIEFEFQVLKNQVNPHFLFNSFSTLMSLIEDHPSLALEYTEKLSDFFRNILQYKDTRVITIEEELSLTDNYIFIQKKRYGDHLQVEVELEQKTRQSYLPPMTLQMLMENAVKHNVISKEMPLLIRVYEKDGALIVENRLQPRKQAEPSTGIGLDNIFKRYRLTTTQEPVIEKTNEIFRVCLPLIHA